MASAMDLVAGGPALAEGLASASMRQVGDC
jgi:hypothetical protein